MRICNISNIVEHCFIIDVKDVYSFIKYSLHTTTIRMKLRFIKYRISYVEIYRIHRDIFNQVIFVRRAKTCPLLFIN